jgi:hypothetical protein
MHGINHNNIRLKISNCWFFTLVEGRKESEREKIEKQTKNYEGRQKACTLRHGVKENGLWVHT